MRRGAFSVALLLGGVNAGCVNLRPPPAPLSAEAAGGAPNQVWTTRAGRRFTGRTALTGDTFYGAGVDRKVYAVDLESGAVRWSARLSGMIVGGVLLSGDTIYAATSRPQGRVTALDRGTGKKIWEKGTGTVGAPLALWRGMLIAPTQLGDVVGLDPSTGTIKWRRRLGVARVSAVPADSASVLVATVDSLFVIGTADGEVVRRARSPGTILSPWISLDSSLVAGTTDSLVISIRPRDLSVSWQVKVDAPVLDSPAAIGDTLYAATRRGTLYRIIADSAPQATPVVALDWAITAPVTVMDGQILLGGADGAIRALAPNGAEQWRVQVWRPVELGPVALSDGLLAVGGDGDLHRYRR
ncbi:MAG TPA: PQQ-binding-like beta-propeller repeat protein [Gemmatimonadales bacterium]